MAYNVVQKIRNNYYLYEVTSEWNPDTKRSNQKRKYIGKCDEEGNLLNTDTNEVISKDLGEYYLLFHIAKSCGLWKALCDVYGVDTAKIMISYSFIRCTRCCPPTQSAYAVRNSTMPDYFGIPLDSRSLTLEGYLNILGNAYASKDELFRAIPHGKSVMVFNSDVLREPFHFYKLYGSKSRFNFDEFPLRTHFSAVDVRTNLPFYFKLAKYNGVDRVSLNAVCDELRTMGAEDITFNLRISDCTENEVPKYLASGFNTILNLGSDSPFANEIMSCHLNNLEYDTIFVYGSLYRYLKLTHNFFVTECDVYIVQDSKAHEDRAHTFYRMLDNVERTLSGMKWTKDFVERIKDQYGETNLLDMFVYSEGEDGKVCVERNRDAILRQESLFGRTVIVTNSSIGIKDILQSASYSNRYDQDLSIFRTDLQGGATLFPSNETAVASMLGDFISHHLKIVLMKMLSGTELSKEMNYLDVFSAVSTIKGYWINGKYSVSKINAEHEKIFRTFGIEPPSVETRNKPYI